MSTRENIRLIPRAPFQLLAHFSNRVENSLDPNQLAPKIYCYCACVKRHQQLRSLWRVPQLKVSS